MQGRVDIKGAITERTCHAVRIACCSIFFLSLSTGGVAQEPEYRKITEEDGPNTESYIFDVGQDEEGNMWFCSFTGIDRYNGVQTTHYGPQGELKDRFVLRCFPGPRGMSFLDYSGRLIYHQDGKFLSYPDPDSLSFSFSEGRTYNVQQYGDSGIVVGRYKMGCGYLDAQGRYHPLVSGASGYRGAGVLLSPRAKQPICFTVKESSGSDDLRHIRLYDSLAAPLFEYELDTLIPHIKDHVYATLLPDGRIAMAWGNHLLITSRERVLQHIVLDDYISFLFADALNNLWVACSRDGVLRFPRGNLYAGSEKRLFEGTDILTMRADRGGGLWLAGQSDGILYMPAPSFAYTSIHSGKTLKDLYSILIAEKEIYLGTNEGVLFMLKGDGIEEVNVSKAFFERDRYAIQDIFKDTSGNHLLLGIAERIALLSEDGKLSEVHQEWFEGNRVSDFVPSRFDSKIWGVAGRSIYELRDGVITHSVPNVPDIFYTLVEDDDGALWLGGGQGVWKYEHGRFINYAEQYDLFRGRIRSLCMWKGMLWAHNYNSGVVVMRSDGSFFQLPDDIRPTLFRPENDTLWAMSRHAIHKFQFTGNDSVSHHAHVVSYAVNANLWSFDLTDTAFYFATSEGLLAVPRQVINAKRSSTKTFVTQVKINYRDTAISNAYELSHDQNNISIGFHGASYKSSTPVNYRYRMIGVDDQWQYTTEQSLQYIRLPPGEYRFEVAVRNHDRIWAEVPTTVSFTIFPPFWETWWFRLLVAFVILSGIYALVRLQMNRAEKKRLLDRELVRLESQALRAQINPHFIFNVLNAIQGYVSRGDTASSEAYLGKFALLIRSVLENSDRGFVPLDEELETLRYYLDMERMRFNNRFDYEVVLKDMEDPGDILVPTMLIQPYLENAVVHGLSNKAKGGRIQLLLRQDHDLLECTVTDNGIGRCSAEEQNEPREHKPLGMLITKKRLELLYRQTTHKFTVEIEDMSDMDPQRSGTRIRIVFPIQ